MAYETSLREWAKGKKCPLCDHVDFNTSMLQQHMEETHFSDDSDFVVKENGPAKDKVEHSGEDADEPVYVDCNEPGCGERLLITDLDAHLDIHQAENVDSAELKRSVTLEEVPKASGSSTDRYRHSESLEIPSESSRRPSEASSGGRERKRARESSMAEALEKTRDASTSRSSSSLKQKMAGWLKSKTHSSSSGSKDDGKVKRLGKLELGPYAREKQMPSWLRRQLEEDQKRIPRNIIGQDGRTQTVSYVANQADELIPVLAQLLRSQHGLRVAYLCDSTVTYYCKTRNEGGFCGYRNAQMMLSYIVNSGAPGHDRLENRVPNIFKMQDYIEEAWDRGINTAGRIETGGVRGTRKYIGTPEVQAMLEYLQIDCTPSAYATTADALAFTQLYASVEGYFSTAARYALDPEDTKIVQTRLPPIYLQHRGHSLTIVGFERRKSGNCSVLVYDPSFRPSAAALDLVGKTFSHGRADEVLKPFRRSDRYLSKYDDFELLFLNPPPWALGGSHGGGEHIQEQDISRGGSVGGSSSHDHIEV